MTKKTITRTEYLTDLENTRRELEAYRKLASGYETLADLPENRGIAARQYHTKSRESYHLANRCADFLEKLEALNPEDFPDD